VRAGVPTRRALPFGRAIRAHQMKRATRRLPYLFRGTQGRLNHWNLKLAGDEGETLGTCHDKVDEYAESTPLTVALTAK